MYQPRCQFVQEANFGTATKNLFHLNNIFPIEELLVNVFKGHLIGHWSFLTTKFMHLQKFERVSYI